MRIILTGSRRDPGTRSGMDFWMPQITSAIQDYLEPLDMWDDWAGQPDGEVTLVFGDCKTGLDFWALQWALVNNVNFEWFEADWNKFDKPAGPIRNQEMVDSGGDVVLAFPLGNSPGTRDCMRRAEKAGIQVINITEG